MPDNLRWWLIRDANGAWRVDGPPLISIGVSVNGTDVSINPGPGIDGTYRIGIRHDSAVHLGELNLRNFAVAGAPLPIPPNLQGDLIAIDKRTQRGAIICVVVHQKRLWFIPLPSFNLTITAEELPPGV